MSSEAILLNLLPKARYLSAFLLGFLLRISNADAGFRFQVSSFRRAEGFWLEAELRFPLASSCFLSELSLSSSPLFLPLNLLSSSFLLLPLASSLLLLQVSGGFKFQEGAESLEQRFWLEASTLSNRGEMRSICLRVATMHSTLAGSQYH